MSGFAWSPTEGTLDAANLTEWLKERGASNYEELHGWSVTHPAEFWDAVVKRLDVKLRQPYRSVLDGGEWLPGALLNIGESCFREPLDAVAIVTANRSITRSELWTMSCRVANGLHAMGLREGDAVAFYLSLSAEAVAAYLGVILAGCVAVSIPESSPVEEIEKRLRIGGARAVFTQQELVRGTKRLPLYDKIKAATALPVVVIGASWQDFLGSGDFTAAARRPHDALHILFSSGTTGEPKAIPWDQTTPIKCASDGHFHQDVKPGDVLCWPTSLGWMMGPWLIFASLMNGAAMALYDGSPSERGFCEFVQNAGVTILGVVPSLVSSWKESSFPDIDWSRVRLFSSTGEASNPHDYRWLMSANQPDGAMRPIIEYCGGTEIGGGYITSNILTPQNPAEFNCKAMGIDFVLRDDEVFLVPPSVGLSRRLLNANNHEIYYAGCPILDGKQLRRHGDRMIVVGTNRWRSDGREDNAMNLGGIKVGSSEIERVVAHVSGVRETAAVGVPPKDGGAERLVIFVVCTVVCTRDAEKEALLTRMRVAIKQHLNPLFHLHDIVLVDALPRTPSNKVMHKELRATLLAR
jgi:acetyl-CoA synthetase